MEQPRRLCAWRSCILGNRQHALALLGHEGTHYAIHKNKRINDAISDVLGMWMVGLTTSGYRNIHFEHHKHLNTDRDPELMHRSSKAPQWDLPMTFGKIMAVSRLWIWSAIPSPTI